jgi:hypothetical protein
MTPLYGEMEIRSKGEICKIDRYITAETQRVCENRLVFLCALCDPCGEFLNAKEKMMVELGIAGLDTCTCTCSAGASVETNSIILHTNLREFSHKCPRNLLC